MTCQGALRTTVAATALSSPQDSYFQGQCSAREVRLIWVSGTLPLSSSVAPLNSCPEELRKDWTCQEAGGKLASLGVG